MVNTTGGLTSARSREDLAPLPSESGDQLIERGGECLDAVCLQLFGDRVYVKTKGRRSRQYGFRFLVLCSEGDPNASVIAKRIERRGRNRRDRIWTNQRFEVQDIDPVTGVTDHRALVTDLVLNQ